MRASATPTYLAMWAAARMSRRAVRARPPPPASQPRSLFCVGDVAGAAVTGAPEPGRPGGAAPCGAERPHGRSRTCGGSTSCGRTPATVYGDRDAKNQPTTEPLRPATPRAGRPERDSAEAASWVYQTIALATRPA